MRAPVWLISLLAAGAAAVAAGLTGGSAAPRAILADRSPNAMPVDVELVIAVDISYSMDPEEQALQREGYITGITSREFLHALRRAEIMTSEKANSVKMAFGKNKLEITANSPDVGEAKETLGINYKGPEMAIAFNPKYVIDPLNALTNDEVFFELIDELSPGVLKINGPFLYVVMPMRLT